MKGRKPVPAVGAGPALPDGLPRCPPHLSDVARREWRRLATPLYEVGVLTLADRAALAAYCQAYGRWVEAEERLKETPVLLKTRSGYVQQSPWLAIANKQLELMGRYMTELGLTPASRSRVAVAGGESTTEYVAPVIRNFVLYRDEQGERQQKALPAPGEPGPHGTGRDTACRDVDPAT
jgi:P27 family predicted phage terminase small subunit